MADPRDLVAEVPSFFPHSSYNLNIERLSAPLLFLSKVKISVRVLICVFFLQVNLYILTHCSLMLAILTAVKRHLIRTQIVRPLNNRCSTGKPAP